MIPTTPWLTDWRGPQGAAWADRNPTSAWATDDSWLIRYGMRKTDLVREMLELVPRETSWLELGCSTGAHLRCLNVAGFPNGFGLDVSFPALQACPKGAVVLADGCHLPFADQSWDGITTSGGLMHVGPLHPFLVDCLREIDRVARRWLFSIELRTDEPSEIRFGPNGMLMPSAWTYPWEHLLPRALALRWELRAHLVLRSERFKDMSVVLLERKGTVE